VRTRNPAAESKDVVFPEPISAQPATKSVAATAAKINMMFGLGFLIFIFCLCRLVVANREMALGTIDNPTRYFFAI
jgi:hypothetical protein